LGGGLTFFFWVADYLLSIILQGGKGFDDVTGRIKVARGKTTATPAATNISGSGVNKKKTTTQERASERDGIIKLLRTHNIFLLTPHIFFNI
jgi:hypothetical protein